jgi:hypothetical protein
MRALIKLFSLLILLSVLAVLAIAWFALSDAPLVAKPAQLSHQDIARARNILKQNDPRNIPPGNHHVIEISAKDLNLAADYLLQQLARGSAKLAITTDHLLVQASFHIPRVPWRNVVNVVGTIQTRDGHPQITALRLGALTVPDRLANLAARQVFDYLYARARLDDNSDPIRQLQLLPERLRLTYQWDPALLDKARDTLMSGSDLEALRLYHDRLIDLQARGVGTKGPLLDLLQPMFATALERSSDRDPIEENTALLTVLGTWAGGQNINRLVPGSTRRPRAFRLKIQRRTDFGQHFLTSAALAARGDSALSDAVGLFKEISDTDHGSGFSFTDIAADRAGTRFGEFATRSHDDARRLQQRMAAGVVEGDIMPPARDLPENMRSDEFKQRFGYVGSPAYRQLMDEIEQRVNSCSLYRN